MIEPTAFLWGKEAGYLAAFVARLIRRGEHALTLTAVVIIFCGPHRVRSNLTGKETDMSDVAKTVKRDRQRVGLVGLGNMGRGMAANLLKHGFPLTVFIRSERAARWAEEHPGASHTRSLRELAELSEVVLLAVTDGPAVQQVLFDEDGVMAGLRPGSVVVDMTTSSPASVEETYHRLASQRVPQLDAPMSGGATGAREGKMILMVGGEAEVLERCRPIFTAIARKIVHTGGPGSGQRVKLLQNQLSFTLFLATCEAVWMGKAQGFDAAMLVDVFQNSNARSYESEFRFPKFIVPGRFESGAVIALAMKDLRLAREVRQAAGVELPLAEKVFRYWELAMEEVGGEQDFTRVFDLVKDAADLTGLARKV